MVVPCLTALPKGQTQKDQVAHPPARPEWTEPVLDPKEGFPEANQWPVMWFTQKSKVGLSQEFFIEKQGQIERFSKEKLIVSNVKKATVQYDTPVVVQLVSRVSLTTPWTAAH